MAASDTDAIDRLDFYLDSIALGAWRSTHGADRTFVSTDRRLRHLFEAPTPDPAFATQLREGLFGQPAAATGHGDAAVTGIARWRGVRLVREWSSRTLAASATAAVLLLTLVSGVLTYRLAAVGPRAEGPSQELYVSTGVGDGCEGPVRLVQVDSMTFGDLDHPRDLVMCNVGQFQQTWSFSADGSTAATIEYSYRRVTETYDPTNVPDDAVTIVVRDGRTGDERLRFHPPAHVARPRLSADGTQLVVEVVQSEFDSRVQPPAWYVYDTSDGRLNSTTLGETWSGYESWIDPTATHLYRLVPSAQPSADPVPMTLIAYDLNTGVEEGRIELSEVLGGSWPTETMTEIPGTDSEYPLIAHLSPALAVSPDGRQLAIVHADADAVTLINAERLEIERTISLTRPTGWLDRLVGLLPLVPSEAEAKGPSPGTTREAVFAPDGGHLYIWGSTISVDEGGTMTPDGLGLQMVDLNNGTVLAEGLLGEEVTSVLIAPDGHSIYASGPSEPVAYYVADVRSEIRRLDAMSLETLAERTFDGSRVLMQRPVASN